MPGQVLNVDIPGFTETRLVSAPRRLSSRLGFWRHSSRVACAVSIISKVCRADHTRGSDQAPAEEGLPDTAVSTSSPKSELMKLSPHHKYRGGSPGQIDIQGVPGPVKKRNQTYLSSPK